MTRNEQVAHLIADFPGLTMPEICQHLQLSRGIVVQALINLLDQNLIRRDGTRRKYTYIPLDAVRIGVATH